MTAVVIAYSSVSQAAPVSIATPNPYRHQLAKGQLQQLGSMSSRKVTTILRGRRERPCDACRKRKSKCVMNDGQRNCAACGIHGQDCTYMEDPQPRKRRLDSDGKESDIPKRRSTVSSACDVMDEASARREHDSSLSTVEASSSEWPRREPSPIEWQQYGTHIGPTTELEPMFFDLSQSSGVPTLHSTYRKTDGRTAFIFDQTEAEMSNDAKSVTLRNVERLVGPHGPLLMRIYIDTAHRSFPIVEEDFLHDYNNGKRSNLDPALLSAIFALVTPLLSSKGSKSPSPYPDVAQLEDIALRSFGDALCKPLLSTIQAGLLLMQRPNVDSKTLNTQLVGIAYELGLHLDCTSWATSTAERALRKRLAWALYMQDKWCSLIHGRPSAISKSNWAVQDLLDEDFSAASDSSEDELTSVSELERGRSLFKQMVNLTEILSTVLDTFYTLQAMQEVDDAAQNGTRLILERAKPVQIRLKEWFSRLPGYLKMDNTMTGKPSFTGYLHLAYFATEITLHRCIIRSLESSNGDPYLTHICRSAAKTRLISAMDFVNRLRSEHLDSFWYFPSRVNFALIGTFGSLLLATAPCQEEADFYRTRLSEYRWTLSVSSKTAGFLSFAVESLDSSSTLLQNLPQKPSTSEVSLKFSATHSMQSISPPQDELMTDAPSMHLGQLPRMEAGGALNSESGLVSPSTSTSSGSTTYEAYV